MVTERQEAPDLVVQSYEQRFRVPCCCPRPVQRSSSAPAAELGASSTLALVGNCSQSRGKEYLEGKEAKRD